MEKFGSLAYGNILHMRSFRDEHNGSTACNDADPCPTLRTGVRGISLPAPLDAQAGTEVQTGLLSRLSPHPVGALYGDAMEVPARAERAQRETGHSRYDRVQSLCQMGG